MDRSDPPPAVIEASSCVPFIVRAFPSTCPIPPPIRGLRSAGLSGARALTRLILLLLENLGSRDRHRLRSALERHEGSFGRDADPSMMSTEIHASWQTLPEAYAAAGLADLAAQAARAASPPQADAAPAPRRDAPGGFDPVERPQPSVRPPFAQAPELDAARPVAPIRDYGSGSTALTQPMWRTPFVALPGVRYVRTPDHLLRRPVPPDTPIAPVDPIVPADKDDVGRDDEAAVEARAEAEPVAELAGPPRAPLARLKIVSGYDLERPLPANDTDEEADFAGTDAIATSVNLANAADAPPAPARPLEDGGSEAAPAPDHSAPTAVPLTAPDTPAPPRVAQAFAVVVRPKGERAAPPADAVPATPPVLTIRRRPEISWTYPPVALLAEPRKPEGIAMTTDALEQNARLLESVLEDFGVRGEIIHVRAGPVVTLYELEPAPGMKSSRVIGLADDIARSMSALSARVAVVPGRNAIGIELPNERRETVYFRELVDSDSFRSTQHKLALCLGKTIGGENVIAELAKMPHLLVAGTTGSGKSVAINTMILSLLYRLRPEECRLIMVDPKMLELSVYDGIPHLLTPVVTDPKKAVVALKWAVREMEDRYKKMSKLGVRNIDGFNARVAQAKATGEVITIAVTTGYDKETGKPITGDEALDLTPLPYIVVIVDEMADLMMVAGKEIEGAIQRLAQMARAAGIHLIMATQRPSVDVITGTIKANFPDPDLLPGPRPRSTAARSSASRAPSNCSARATCCTCRGAAGSTASTAPSCPTTRSRRSWRI